MTNPDSPSPSNSGNPYPPPPPLPEHASEPLQFDQVDYGTAGKALPGLSCAACHTPITDNYYMVNGVVACSKCKADLQGSVTGGSKIVRLATAMFFGLGAAILSAVTYFFFVKFTGFQFALITIGMGWFIGAAVHKGSRGRGGWFYMLIAVIFTYLAIGYSVTTYSLLEESGDEAVASQTHTSSSDMTTTTSEMSDDISEITPEEKNVYVMTIIGTIIVLGAMAPVLMAISSPMLILIYGFGLWQAAKMNVGTKVNFTGPYRVGGAPPPLP